ncbi:hypothetical protein H7J51_13695 [Mycobacterium crocinum]|uniref:Intersectin-EH binding protein Ibp1 n=1 Tax=Mycolicibacterium crocinum TaxID=388459 RepID=A0ABY3TQ72_9MYCO|nr:hypothetical protein [Mycolicibacterium crocinum]MCV7216333.1 hypothetical protein [Mycolicibacterium crocinum]ULN41300.1 hypothetical protein MI149_27560 [Mycolicibacterium crocinum]
MTTATTRRMLYVAIGLAIATAPAVAVFAVADPAPRLAAQCADTDTEDSFSMDCAPTIIPDTSDQLTEAEVAEPGWNGGNHSGGGGGGGGHR